MKFAQNWPFWAFLAAVYLPALRPLFKYAPLPELAAPALLLGLAVALWTLLNPPQALRRWLDSPWPTALLVVALSAVAAFVYPLADALKLRGMGSDADDAMVLGGQALMHGLNPYLFSTYFGNPLSPGPGWLVLAAPFAAAGVYALMLPLAVALAALLLRQGGQSWYAVSAWLGGIFACLLLWELAAVGNDLPLWGLLLVCAVVLLGRPRLPYWGLPALVLLVGMLATARVAFFYLPVLVGFSLFAVWPRRAVAVALGGSAVMAALHGAFWWWGGGAVYPPLHLVGRAEGLLAGPTLYGAGLFLLLVGIAMLYHWRWWAPPVQVACGLGAPLLVLALAELNQHGQFAAWEGATFLVPALPVVLYALCARLTADRRGRVLGQER